MLPYLRFRSLGSVGDDSTFNFLKVFFPSSAIVPQTSVIISGVHVRVCQGLGLGLRLILSLCDWQSNGALGCPGRARCCHERKWSCDFSAPVAKHWALIVKGTPGKSVITMELPLQLPFSF